MKTKGKYILSKGEPVEETDLIKWARWFEKAGNMRALARDEINGSVVSTVFLGMDYNFLGDGPPILWETMVFNKDRDSDLQQRYASKDEALRGHMEIVKKLKEGTTT